MHQPMYRDPFTGKYTLPWVRLHACKAYYDMASVLQQYPDIKVSINLVPSLVEQLIDYTSNNAADTFYEYSIKPAGEISYEDKAFILRYFFMSNWETMVKPYQRYYDLLLKRGKKIDPDSMDSLISIFNKQDFLDLQVWFNLSWFGFTALAQYPDIVKLKQKMRNFTEQDKKFVLDTQMNITKKILPLYKELSTSGQIEITTSPFYHAIMPLVYDTDIARRAMPKAALPKRATYPEDVLAQLKLGRQFLIDQLGVAPKGLWPSEESVAPEIIPLVKEAGFEWMVTDEDILFASIGTERKGEFLYKPYNAIFHNSNMTVIFRDKLISDFIGFDCAKYTNKNDAVEYIVKNLLDIKSYLDTKRMNGLVTIALDGENAWEYFINSGRNFLNGLYSRLSKTQGLKTTTVSGYLESNKPDSSITNLYSGSWINKNFYIWIGQEEKNLAWDYLGSTREYLKAHIAELTPEQAANALKHIYIAEGSDWFWWYGDTFYTENEEEFDKLFRKNLKKVLEIMKKPVLDFLHTPVIAISETGPKTQPLGFITPILDGISTDYYEWESGGVCYYTAAGSMHNPNPYIHKICYGFDLNNLYVRIDHSMEKIRSEDTDLYFAINIFDHSFEYRITIPIKKMLGTAPYYELYYAKDQTNFELVKKSNDIAILKIIELKIPFADINANPDMKLNIVISARSEDMELEKYPSTGLITITVPDKDYKKKMWSV